MHEIRRLARANPLLVDGVFAMALAVTAELEIWSGASGSRAFLGVVALLMTLPLTLRRRRPLLVLTVVLGASLAQSLVDPNADLAGILIVAIIVAAYSTAAYCSRPAGVAGGLLGAFAIAGSVDRQGGGVGNYLFAVAIFVGAWLAGFVVRARDRRTEELQQMTVVLEQEQEARSRAAVAEERARIARDLHDAVAHSVSLIVVQAGAERLALPAEASSTREVLRSIEEGGRQALVEMRRLVEMLRREDEELSLAPQPSLAHLEFLVQQVCEAGLPVELQVEGEPRSLPPGVDLSAYRIVQEALTNALRHAGPAQVRVTVRYTADQLELEVADDGAGDATSPDGGGHGLVGMRERVAVFGGVLEANPRREGGYRLRATLPLRPSQA